MNTTPEPEPAPVDPSAILTIFIRAAYRGDITIYNPETGEPYAFWSFTETRDVIYERRFTLEPPASKADTVEETDEHKT